MDPEKRKELAKKIPKAQIPGPWRGFLIYGFLAILGLFLFYSFFSQVKPTKEIPLSQVIGDVKDGKVDKIEVDGARLIVQLKNGQTVYSRKEETEVLTETFKNSNIDPSTVAITVKDRSFSQIWVTVFTTFLPILLMVAFFFFIFRQAREAGGQVFSFGQSRAKLFSRDMPKVTFSDVAGVDEAKKELEEVVEFLKHPEKFRALGARTPKGVLLVGPAGTGKTLLARAIAGEAGVPFFSVAGSEFMEMLVGVGASRVRDLFSNAKKTAPAIIFVDEIESIGRMRGFGFSGGHDEREQTLNQILVEMDGFAPNDNVIVLAASVTGDTPILIKENEEVKLVNIGDFVDGYYEDGQGGIEKTAEDVETLGFERRISPNTGNRLYFQNSKFKKVRSVFRHRVKEIYEISYLGGKIRTTGNHSVFVRTPQGLVPKKVSLLKKGDILVDLPLKVNRTTRSLREIRAHRFDQDFQLPLPVYQESKEDYNWERKYLFAQENYGQLSQAQIGAQIGVSQSTVGNWLRGELFPRAISRNYFNHELPDEVEATPELCRLFGYYVAEGYARKGVDFCFNLKEENLISDLKKLMKGIFGLDPDRQRYITDNNAVNIIYYSQPVGEFFAKYCGKGAVNKHVPAFLFEAPKEYFIEFLRGVLLGDGYVDKRGRGEITSVSKQLIMELNWLCRMHGIKAYIHSFVAQKGRRIKNGKPLEETKAYRLGFGIANNPFTYITTIKDNPIKRPIVRRVRKLPFNGYVYDLCGVENEAFFGGESPILLHNTNRPDLLDPALTRPGRFDRRVALDMPDIEGRKAIIKIHMRGKPFAPEADIEKIARRTVGFSGADLANMLNEAAILAAREGKKAIDNKDLEEAATKVKLGPQKKRIQTEEDRIMTAYHEAGHAIVAHSLPKMDPVHRISIVSRGMTGGHTLIPPQVDRQTETKSHLLEMITTLLGGRASEELVFNEVTTGAGNDLDIATGIAREMVTEFGMSDLGPINIGPKFQFGVWPTDFESHGYSQDLAAKIDGEVRKIIDHCFVNARKILREERDKLDLVAKELLEKETLEGDEFEKLIGSKKGEKEEKTEAPKSEVTPTQASA